MSTGVKRTLAWIGTPERAPRVIAAVPLTFLALQLLGGAVIEGPAGMVAPEALPGYLIHAVIVVPILAGARFLARGSLAETRYPRLIAWYLGGTLVVLALNTVTVLLFPPEPLVELTGWITFAGSMGAAGGFVVGLTEARAIDRAVAAEREAAEAELLAEQRDRFEYMNALLRHEVLNNVQVIRGNAEYLLAAIDTGDDDTGGLDTGDVDGVDLEACLGTISRQSDDMADVIEDVRLVSKGLENTELEPIDLETVLRAEVADLADSTEPVETELECPESVHVVADGLLARVFSNLLANAVEHNDADVARVSVSVRANDERVRVRIADNGPGIPERTRDTLFDRSTGPHGVGLYLVDTLVAHYGGSVELAESDAEGSVFVVELERATPDHAERASEGVFSAVETTRAGGASERRHGAFDAEASVVADDED